MGTCNSHLAFNNLGVARTIDVSGSINPDGTILGAEFPLDDVRLGPLGSEVFAEPGQLLNNSRTGGTSPEDCYIFKFMGYRE